jgi:hypothetical protein
MKTYILLLLVVSFQMSSSQDLVISKDVPKNIKVRKVIKKYINSIGGENNLTNIQTLQKKGIVTIEGVPDQHTMKALVIYKEPNLYCSVLEMNNVGQIQSTKYDGAICTITRQNNTEIITKEITGDLLIEKIKEFEPFPILEEINKQSIFSIIELHSNKDSLLYKIQINDDNNSFFFFDAKSGFLVKKETILYGALKRKKIIEYKDYRQVDNILVPFLITELIEELGNIIQNTSTIIEEVIINKPFELINFQ